MKLAILGVPSSIGARNPGTEKAPAALRQAGLLDRLRAADVAVEDQGDQALVPFRPDPDPANRNHQNLSGVSAMARTLAGRVEAALREDCRLLILGGDCTVALGSLAGAARVLLDPGLAYFDRDAELNTPKTTPSGILDGMVVAHLLGRGIMDLARAENGAPLLRPGRLALLGVERLDPQEVPVFEALPSLRIAAAEIRRQGGASIATEVLRRLGREGEKFHIHFDLDVLDGSEMPAVDFPSPGGLPLAQARLLLAHLWDSPACFGLEVTNFNPDKDPGGTAAKTVVDWLVSGLSGRNTPS